MIFLLTSFITNFQDQIRPSKKYRGGCAILWAYKVVTGLTLATHLNKQDSFYVTQKINCILNPGQIMRHLCKV